MAAGRVLRVPGLRKLAGGDYASIADNLSDFLLNKERGLEQFYEIVRQGTRSE